MILAKTLPKNALQIMAAKKRRKPTMLRMRGRWMKEVKKRAREHMAVM